MFASFNRPGCRAARRTWGNAVKPDYDRRLNFGVAFWIPMLPLVVAFSSPAIGSPRSDMQRIYDNVATEQSDRYDTVLMSKSSSMIDLCVQAGIVAASYLQANRAAEYNKWKATEREDCKSAEAGVISDLQY